MHRPLSVAAVVLGFALVAGCSTGSTDDKAQDDSSAIQGSHAEEGAFPVTVKHRFGETEIESEPQRVVTLGSADQDNVLALGVVPVAVPKITWGPNENNSTDWFDEALAELDGPAPAQLDTSDAIPVDEVAKLEPDLILASNSAMTKQEYDQLSKIAPVVAPPGADWLTSWEDSLEQAGLALGRPTKAAEVEKSTEALIDGVEEENPEVEQTDFLFTYFDPSDLGTVGVYSEEDPRVAILEEMGFEVPDQVERLVPEGEFYGSVSAERANTLDSDVLVTYLDSEKQLQQVKDNALLGRIPAVAADKVVALPADGVGVAVTSPTPLSIPVIVDEVVPQIVEASKGSPTSSASQSATR